MITFLEFEVSEQVENGKEKLRIKLPNYNPDMGKGNVHVILITSWR